MPAADRLAGDHPRYAKQGRACGCLLCPCHPVYIRNAETDHPASGYPFSSPDPSTLEISVNFFGIDPNQPVEAEWLSGRFRLTADPQGFKPSGG